MTRQEAREHINGQLESYLKGMGINTGQNFPCLFCGEGHKTPNMGYHVDPDGKQRVHCFACGEKDDLLGILKRAGDSEREIFERYGIAVEAENSPIGQRKPAEGKKPLPAEQSAAQGQNNAAGEPPEDYRPFFLQAAQALQGSAEARAYLQGRGISLGTAGRFKLGYDPCWRHPKAPNPPPTARVIIPTGRHTYTARAIDPAANPKYAKQKVKGGDSVDGMPLYNARALKGKDSPFIFVVEGEFDVLSVVEAGGQAVGIGSTANARKFVQAVQKTPPTAPLVLSLDVDGDSKAGQKAQAEIEAGLEALKIPFFEANISGAYKDPNEHLQANREAFAELVRYPMGAAY